MYADALPSQAIAEPLPTASPTFSKPKGTIDIPHATSSPWALMFPFFIVMLIVLFLIRRKKGFVMAIPEYANRIPGYADRVPKYAKRVPNYTKNAPGLAKAVPRIAMNIMKKSPWMRSAVTKA